MNPKYLASAFVVAAAASQLGATNCGEITRDPGFDLWCGDSLCAWKLERGNIKEVPTWNAGDPGVQLVGSDVAIEQLTPVDSTDGTCIEFDMIANVDESAQAVLNVDIDGDGSVEYSEQIPTSSWQPLTFLMSVAAPYSGIRFEIAKVGNGNAVLAEISAKLAEDGACAGLPTISSGPQPDGEPCNTGGDCTSGICTASPFGSVFSFGQSTLTCESCDATSCGGGSGSGSGSGSDYVCGAAPATAPTRSIPTACVAPASAPLGAMCASDAECASALCENNFCSSCDPLSTTSCPSGDACGSAWASETSGDDMLPELGPYVCGPFSGHGASDAPCANNADCASGVCNGTPRMQCFDGRTCATNADCPVGEFSDPTLENGTCVTVGVQGGTCQ